MPGVNTPQEGERQRTQVDYSQSCQQRKSPAARSWARLGLPAEPALQRCGLPRFARLGGGVRADGGAGGHGQPLAQQYARPEFADQRLALGRARGVGSLVGQERVQPHAARQRDGDVDQPMDRILANEVEIGLEGMIVAR